MKFSDLKDAVPFKTILVDEGGVERCFVAINPYNNRVITTRSVTGYPYCWTEAEIKDWIIKQPEKEKPESPELLDSRMESVETHSVINRGKLNALIRWAKWVEEIGLEIREK